MKKIEVVRWNPEFYPKEAGALYEYLEGECELPEEDGDPYYWTGVV